MSAVISKCGKYRYVLKRKISQPLRWVKPCLFIMLNPSKADAELDDPTIKKCIKFAKREGCTSLTVINLYALRATNPNELLRHEEPGGPHNGAWTVTEIEKTAGGIAILAWGSHTAVRGVSHLIPDLIKVIKNEIGQPYCFHINKDGNPKHPLYVKDNAPLIPYKPPTKEGL